MERTRYSFTVPITDESVKKWIRMQENLGISLRLLIKSDIVRNGYTDTLCRLASQSTVRRGRPPASEYRQEPDMDEVPESREEPDLAEKKREYHKPVAAEPVAEKKKLAVSVPEEDPEDDEEMFDPDSMDIMDLIRK